MDDDVYAPFHERLLWNFYIADRNKTTFEHVEEVPNWVPQMIPIFISLYIAEEIVHYFKYGKRMARSNDGFTSLALGIVRDVIKLLTRGCELIGYQYIYESRIFDFDWRSPWIWWIAAIAVDFCYYWLHRLSHEINLFWSGHQVHHSSEEYNLTTALRQSAFQQFFTIGIYQPLALLGVPLPALLVHIQLNLFYQFWIHTELVDNLGPLEWILNTASHHRVHHGSNKWCLDKNYAGFLIIWDRMFGTFQPERKDEKIVYGLVSQPQTFEPIYLQLFYFKYAFDKAFSMKTWTDFLKALFYGPGWQPGTPRLGDENALPDKTPIRAKYNPKIAPWLEYYLLAHFFIVVIIYQKLMLEYATFNWLTALMFMAFVFVSLFTIGSTFDGHWLAPFVEAVRCIVTVAVIRYKSVMGYPVVDMAVVGYFAVSSIIWTSTSLTIISTKKDKQKNN